MEKKRRKGNRLPEFDYGQSGAYFVTICTRDRRKILSQVAGSDARVILKPAGIVLERYIRNAPEVEKYVIMPDHVHMIVRLNGDGLSSKLSGIVRAIKALTTKEIGMSIFQRSYYDHVIRNQQDYNEIWEYIDNNPRKWEMTKNLDD